MLQDYSEAIDDYERAMKVDPYAGQADLALASLLATCRDGEVRDGKKAVAIARRWLEAEISIPVWNRHFVLASALAEAGQFPEAVNHAQEAVKRAPEQAQPTLRKFVDLYRNETPFRRNR